MEKLSNDDSKKLANLDIPKYDDKKRLSNAPLTMLNLKKNI